MTDTILNYLVFYLIFPGFLFTVILGMIASWIDRKVTARVQWRVGPPVLQPVYDFVKLMGKEIIIPENSERTIFLLMPPLALATTTVVSTLLWLTFIFQQGFVGDLIVVIYLLMIPSLAVIIGAAASANPLASLGASREMKMMLAYELPFILVCLIPIIKSGSIRIDEILSYQSTQGIILGSVSGVLGFIVAILCMQAKLGLVPFDAAEAETEIMAGTYIEYSGPGLAMFKITKQMLMFVLPIFLVTLFWGGIDVGSVKGIVMGILKYVVLLVLIVLIRNTNPRVRVDQAVRFFWKEMTLISILAVLLALVGY